MDIHGINPQKEQNHANETPFMKCASPMRKKSSIQKPHEKKGKHHMIIDK
jgi:hypothetical protein